MKRVQKIWQELSAQPQEINLSSVQEAEALIKEMSKLEQELKSAARIVTGKQIFCTRFIVS